MKLPRPGRGSAANRASVPPLWSSRSLLSYPLGGALLTLLGLLAAFALVQVNIVQHDTRQARSVAMNHQISTFAAYMDSRLLTLQATLTHIAASPAVIASLRSGDVSAINAQARLLEGSVPHARRVSLLLAGRAEADPGAPVPINFAAKDMLHRAENARWIEPEVYAIGDQLLVYAVTRVVDPERRGANGEPAVLGSLLIALAADYFAAPLQSFAQPAGELAARQRFANGSPLTFVTYGRGEAAAGEQPITARLAAEHWFVTYQPGTDVLAAQAGGSVVGPILVALLALVAGVFLAYYRLHAALRHDAGNLDAYLGHAVTGRTRVTETFRLELFERLATQVGARFGSAGAAGAAPPEQPTAAAHATGDEGATDTAEAAQPKAPPAAAAAPAASAAERPVRDPFGPNDYGIEVVEDDEEALSAFDAERPAEETLVVEEEADRPPVEVDPEIFRAYDVRGIVGRSLTEETAQLLGRAIGAEARARGVDTVVVGGDARASTPILKGELISGLVGSGIKVIDIGEVPTPVLYYAAYAYDTLSGVMVTGSHNPPEYNGFKIMLGGETLAEGAIQGLRSRIEQLDFVSGSGSLESADVVPSYIDRIVSDIVLAQSLKVVVDCGNGIAGAVAPQLLEALGCEVVPLFCEVDSTFPNHHPDPAEPENLQDLIAAVVAEGADLGVAFDGDGDRIGVVTNRGEIIFADRLMMLFARDVVSRNPGADVIYDVKCSRHLNSIVAEYGGRPIMWKTGHSHIKAKIQETGALLGGEFSGHICFLERWYGFDDALYSAARLLEILSTEAGTCSEVFDEFPHTFSTPEIKIATSEARKFELLDEIAERADFGDGSLSTIDGLRIDFADGWGLVRASNTSPVLSLRFEGDTPEALERITGMFQRELAAIDPALEFSA